MIKQKIIIDKNKWKITILYTPLRGNLGEIVNILSRLNCPIKDINKIKRIITFGIKNTGFTYSYIPRKESIIAICTATSKRQYFNTVIHELDHLQNDILEYYNVDKDSEDAAQLIGYVAMKMFKVLFTILNTDYNTNY